jgi:uncharacterized protein
MSDDSSQRASGGDPSQRASGGDPSQRASGGDSSQRASGGDTWTRDEIESPCVQICVIHPTAQLCVGCLRSRDEIARWSQLTSPERRAIIDALPARAPKLRQRRGGRSARIKPQP